MNAIRTTAIILLPTLPFLLQACSSQESLVNYDIPGTAVDTSSAYSSARLTFLYTSIDRDSIKAVAKYVEASYDRIVADLAPDTLSLIRIHLYATLKDVHRAIGWSDAPDWVKGAATSMSEISMISPGSDDLGNSVTYPYMLSCIVHEFAHCVTLHVNKTIANKPRWLWESIALYESGQFVDPSRLTYLSSGSPPSLSDLNNISDTRIYEVGYTLSEFIVNKWGIGGLRASIKSNGDLTACFSMSETEFQDHWYRFVVARYLK